LAAIWIRPTTSSGCDTIAAGFVGSGFTSAGMVGSIATAVSARIGQRADDLQQLQDRAGPAEQLIRDDFVARNPLSARLSIGVPAVKPTVVSSAIPSSRRLYARGGCAVGGAVRAASAGTRFISGSVGTADAPLITS